MAETPDADDDDAANGYPFVASPNMTRASGRRLDVIVVHTMENDEAGGSAESCAAWFASPGAEASAHYCVDDDSIVQCVRERNIAWHAPGINETSIGVEHAGSASQTAAEWNDAYSQAMLALSARLVADVTRRHRIPVVWLSPGALLARRRGITSHANVSRAFRLSAHWDPGPHFPVHAYLAAVRSARRNAAAEPV